MQQAFRSAAIDRILMVRREIEQYLGVVQDVGSLFDASHQVSRREFRTFVEPALKRYASIAALQWIPRIYATERALFEEQARKSFSRFSINDTNQAGDLVKAGSARCIFLFSMCSPISLTSRCWGLIWHQTR